MARQKKEMTTIYLPVGLANKVAELLAGIAYHKAIQMLDVVYNRIYMYQKKELSEWVEIPTDYVYKVLTRRYSSIWKRLVHQNIIERKGTASSFNHKCYQYRFHPDYFGGTEVVNYLKQVESPGYDDVELINWTKFCLKQISFPHGWDVNDMVASKFNCYTTADSSISDRAKQIPHLINIKNKVTRATRSLTNKRLDSNITNLACFYTQQLLLKKEPIVSIDLVNSQACILSNLILKSIYEYDCEDIDCNLSLIIRDIGTNRSNMYYQCSNDADKEMLNVFCDAAINGKLYDVIMNMCDLPSRTRAKKVSFELFFSTIGLFKDSALKEKFQTTFPEVSTIINQYKEHHIEQQKAIYLQDRKLYKIRNKAKCYSQVGSSKFAIFLQRTEAKIFIDDIYNTLREQKILSLSKHDSILVPVSLKDIAMDVIKTKLDIHLPFGYTLRVDQGGKTIETFHQPITKEADAHCILYNLINQDSNKRRENFSDIFDKGYIGKLPSPQGVCFGST